MTPDFINGVVFEGGGAIAALLNIFYMYKDKEVKGMSVISIAFFTSWGLWNIFYYHHIAQPVSWYAGIVLSTFNMIWLGMYLYYKRKKNEK